MASREFRLNPTNIKTITKVLSIDTQFRENYYDTMSTDHLLVLPEPLNNVTSMRLSCIELPNMWYVFNKDKLNNIFRITVDYNPYRMSNTDSSETYSIEIPEGNYLVSTFEEFLNEYFRANDNLKYIKYSINQLTGKSIFRAVNTAGDNLENPYDTDLSFNFSVDFSVDGLSNMETAGWMMGFEHEKYSSNSDDISIDTTQYYDISGGIEVFKNNLIYYNYLESEAAFGRRVQQYLFLDIDDFQKNYTSNTILHILGDRYLGKNILARIVISSGQFTNIIDNGSDRIFKQRNYFGPVRLEKFKIRLLDKYGNVINLNRSNFSFSLEIDMAYSH